MFSPLIPRLCRGSPPRWGLSATALPPRVLLGSPGALFGVRHSGLSPTPSCLFVLKEISYGAHLKEGNAIKIKIMAGVIVHINSIIVWPATDPVYRPFTYSGLYFIGMYLNKSIQLIIILYFKVNYNF